MTDETAAVRPDEEMDWVAVARYLAPHVPYADGPMVVRQFPGGSANLTYLIRFGAHEYVLRRPPLGPVAPGARHGARTQSVVAPVQRFR